MIGYIMRTKKNAKFGVEERTKKPFDADVEAEADAPESD